MLPIWPICTSRQLGAPRLSMAHTGTVGLEGRGMGEGNFCEQWFIVAIWRPKTHDYIGIQGCRFWFWDQFWPQWPWNWQFEASCSISGVKPIASLGTWPPTFRKFPDVLKNGRDVIVTVIPIELVCKTDGMHCLVHEASKEVIVRRVLGEKKLCSLPNVIVDG